MYNKLIYALHCLFCIPVNTGVVKEHEKIFEAACDYATQLASGDNIRSGHLLLAMVVEL